MTEAQARILANRSDDYRARLLCGRWVVWSHAADQVVEFDSVDLIKAAKYAAIAARWDAADAATPKTYTFELTAEQAEDIFAAINAAQIYYGERIKQLTALSDYEMSYSVAGRIRGLELLREGARQRWIEFYQLIEPVRAAEKEGAA